LGEFRPGLNVKTKHTYLPPNGNQILVTRLSIFPIYPRLKTPQKCKLFVKLYAPRTWTSAGRPFIRDSFIQRVRS